MYQSIIFRLYIPVLHSNGFIFFLYTVNIFEMLIRFIKGILTEYGFHQCNTVYVCTYTYVRMCVCI